MKTIIITSVIFLLTICSCPAQELQGKAIYQSKRQYDVKFGGSGLSKAALEKIKKKFKDLSQKTYVLKFNGEESLYSEKRSLGVPGASSDGVQVINTSDGSKLYHNISTKKALNVSNILGKPFLVKDELKNLDWKLVNETKKIGKYTCFKATLTKEVTIDSFFSDDEEKEPKTELITTTVWYTPQIPVHHGPGKYWGLPGLILEVQKEGYSLLCSKIILNPDEEIIIETPNKGKKISQEDFDELQNKKMKEWMKRHGVKHDVKNDDSSGFSITINKG